MHKINDIKRETQLIEFLGFDIKKLDNNNYIINDKEGNKVGFIKNNEGVSLQSTFSYYTQINNEALFVESTEERFGEGTFSIDYKKTGTNVIIHMDPSFSALRIHQFDTHPGNKILMLYITKNEFNFICQEPYDWYLTQYVQVSLDERSYHYNISFNDMTDIEHNFPHYEGDLYCKVNQEKNAFITVKNNWQVWPLESSARHNNGCVSTVKGTIAETILEHKMGINAFNRMRYLVNVVSFRSDIIKFLIDNTEFELPEYLDLFIPEIKENSIKKVNKKINKKII